jgi:molybdate transport system substrate-binding protein
MRRHIPIAALAAAILAQAASAFAAELKVYSTIGVQAALEQLTPQMEKASGAKLAITWGTAAMLVKRIEGGESADVLVLTRDGIDALAKDGKIASGSAVTFASSGIAVAVKAGAPKPDISTPEALKHALLSAKTVAYSDPAAGGASGVYFAKLLERMGIAEEMKAKTRHPPAGGNSANLLLTGEAELAVQQKPEVMSVAGAEVVGLLPAELNNMTTYAAAIGAGAADPKAAQALTRCCNRRTPSRSTRSRASTPAEANFSDNRTFGRQPSISARCHKRSSCLRCTAIKASREA